MDGGQTNNPSAQDFINAFQQIHADHIIRTKQKLNKILSEKTGQPLEVIARDTERDNFMSAEEALKYGLIDKVIYK